VLPAVAPVRTHRRLRLRSATGATGQPAQPTSFADTIPFLVSRKLVIIGDGACGKTSLLSVFTLGYFPTVCANQLDFVMTVPDDR
jgi:hypothetical protein